MNIQLRSDGKAMRLVGSPELTPKEAVQLVNMLIQACAECGEPMAVSADVNSKVQAEVTDAIHAKLVRRVTKVALDLHEKKLSPAQFARTVVDIMLNAAQGRVVQ